MARFGARTVRFLTELRRRQVLRVLGFYAITVWIVLQIAADTFDPLGIPQAVNTAIIVAALLGFPVVAVLAWVFDITPQGLVRTESLEHEARFNEFGEAISERPRLWIDILIITALLGMIAYLLMPTRTDGAADEPTASVAVLPFLNLSTDPDDAFLGDALAEDIIHHLTQIAGLRVAARTSSWAWRDRRAEIPRIARALHVDTILEGSVQREQNLLRVTLQLVKGSDGHHIWSRTFTRPVDALARVNEEIVRSTAQGLGLTLDDREISSISRQRTTNMDAYELYLRALAYSQRPYVGDTLPNALRLFQRAIEIDPQFSAAHAGLCELLLYKYSSERAASDFEYAERACHRALTLDPALIEARHSLGQLYRRSGQLERAEEQFHAVLRDRAYSDAMLGLGWVYMQRSEHDLAVEYFERAINEDPGYWVAHHQYGQYLYEVGEYESAASRFEWEIELTPDSPIGHNALSAATFMLGDIEQALRHIERSQELGYTVANLVTIGLYSWYLRQYQAAADAYRAALQIAPHDFRNWCRLGTTLRRIPGEDAHSREAFQRGLALLEDELAIDPTSGDLHTRAALCHFGAGDVRNALEFMDRALQINPKSVDSTYAAAKIFLATGNIERGAELLSSALANGHRVIIVHDPELDEFRELPDVRAILES